MTDRIPIDVLATYLSQEALDHINWIYSPSRRQIGQCFTMSLGKF